MRSAIGVIASDVPVNLCFTLSPGPRDYNEAAYRREVQVVSALLNRLGLSYVIVRPKGT